MLFHSCLVVFYPEDALRLSFICKAWFILWLTLVAVVVVICTVFGLN